MKNKINYFIIMIYGLLLTLILVGFNNIYGANIDWFTQHTMIPEFLRDYFYETGSLIPDLAFNLGASQNIFNLSYYGLMNPIILVSYLFPFIEMRTYIMLASFILYVLSGLIFYKFLKDDNVSDSNALGCSLALLSISPVTFHFHYHLMFVWYLPFLILSFIGVNKYINNNKSILLIISIFLLILTNYYYAVPSLVVITIYGAYFLLKKEQTIYSFFIDVLKSSLRLICPILMSAFLLLPTLYTIISSNRISTVTNTFKDLFIININETLYASFSIGICFVFIISIVGNLCTKKIKKEELFLNTTLLLITFLPIFMYALNGFLYVRGKVLIPFIILYFISFISFMRNIINRNINIKRFTVFSIIIALYMIITNLENVTIITFLLDIIVTFIVVFIFYKSRKTKHILLPVIIILVISSLVANTNSKYISKDLFRDLKNKENEITELLTNIDNDFYRTDVNAESNKYANKVFNKNQFSTSIYSSTYNSLYKEFYNFNFGNNIISRNSLITGGTDNSLFYTLMGSKYLIAESPYLPLNYREVDSSDNYRLLVNDKVYPIIYTVDNYGSDKVFDSLKFPYNIEYMLYRPTTASKTRNDLNSSIRKLNLNIKNSYEFEIEKNKTYKYVLDEKISNKYLFISFDMDYNQSCDKGDVSITINGVKNKLTCKEWLYHNKNNTFTYVLSSNEDINELKISFTKGKYNISNINLYTMDNNLPTYKSVDNLKLDMKNSIITGNVKLENESYVITSLPIDKGYKVYIDGKKVDSETVNKAFLGFKVSKGEHSIKICYDAPLHNIGKIISICGFMLLIFIIIYEQKKISSN